jgi:putative ABC transport system permease protein
MFTTNLKLAWRNLIKRKFYTLLNLTGLVLAIVCCLLIYVYTTYHSSFDNYHDKAASTFKLVNEVNLDKTEYEKGSSLAMFTAIKESFPEVDGSAFLIGSESFVVNISGSTPKKFREDDIAFTDADWFNLFRYQWIAGSATQLNEPLTVVLTSKLAEKYFNKKNPIGQIISINNQQIKVVGVIADQPYNTDLKANFYLSFSSLKVLIPKIEDGFFTDWGYIVSSQSSFFSFKNPSQKAAIEKKLNLIAKERMGENFAKYFSFKFLPLKSIHFDLRYGGSVQQSLLIVLSIIGMLILIIAVINYVNLVIAQQSRRIVEIGTRKVLGGSAKQLFLQLMTESCLVAAMAVILALSLFIFLMPLVNNWLFADSPVHLISIPNLLFFSALLLLIMSIGAGIYPSWLLSRMSAFKALKNNARSYSRNTGRNTLVVIQNVVAQTMVVCAIVMVMQVHFLKNTDQGFNRDMVAMIPLGFNSENQKEQFAQLLNSLPGVEAFSFCHRSPSSDSQRGATVLFDHRKDWETWPARFAIGDTAYCKTFGIQIIAGRNMRVHPGQPEFLINETMAKMLKVKSNDEILGKNLSAGDEKGIIVGIVKDFNVKSLLEPIEPLVILQTTDLHRNIAVKLSGSNLSVTVQAIQQAFNHILPNEVFSYQFVDEQIAALYKKENLQQKLIWGASGIAIIISTLGLLGMISLVTLQRTKEIGIRKVLGASVTGITALLSRDFMLLVGISFLIASPLSWWLMQQWLQGFAHRIEIKTWMFALAGCLTIIIALITVSLQAVKAAMANPVKSLRNE